MREKQLAEAYYLKACGKSSMKDIYLHRMKDNLQYAKDIVFKSVMDFLSVTRKRYASNVVAASNSSSSSST